jgi:hypothetical protein
MKKTILLTGVIVASLILGGCILGAMTKIDTELTAPAGCSGMHCDLERYGIQFYPLTGASIGISFVLNNKGPEPIMVLWDECAYVDLSGQSLRVSHKGVRFSERDAPQAPSMIVPETILEEVAYPTEKISFSSAAATGWQKLPLFSPLTLKKLPGQSVGMYLMLKIGEDKKPQRFNLRITAIHEPKGGVSDTWQGP